MVVPESPGRRSAGQTTRSLTKMFSSGKKQTNIGEQAPVQPPGDVIVPTHEPRLSLFVQQAMSGVAVGPGGVPGQPWKSSFSALARTLLEAPDRLKNDKAFKAKAFHAILQSLYLYEYVPSDVVTRLLPCLDTLDSKQDAKLYRMLLYLMRKDVSRGHCGTPTIVEHSGTTFAPDVAALKEELERLRVLALNPKQRLGVRRYAIYASAAASRQGSARSIGAMDIVGSLLVEAIKQVDAVDDKGVQVGDSQTDWDLQRSVYGALRIGGMGGNPIAQSCFLGVVSPDPVGARHALALAEEIAVRSPNVVVASLGPLMEATCVAYEGKEVSTVGDKEGDAPQVINLKRDALARTHMARLCAHVIHADQGSLSADSQSGMLFWRMLVLLIAQDESDMVRFAALNALSGNVVSVTDCVLGPTTLGKSRDYSIVQQRRARSWRTLVSQAGREVTSIVNVEGLKGIKFIDLVGRLILLALSKPVKKARFTAAAAVVASIAKSKLAHASLNRSGGQGNDGASKSTEMDRFITVLAKEMGNLIESPISGGQRAACIEALLYMQAAGVPVSLSASSFTLVGADGGSGGAQDSLLVAVLHCARSCPGDAPLFLEYASGVVGIAPEAVDLHKVAALWDAACDQSNKEAALVAALTALRSPLPPSAASEAGASYHRALAAARSDAGWTSFVATAAWWLGERVNAVCGEGCGKTVNAVLLSVDNAQKDDGLDSDGSDAAFSASDDEEDATLNGVAHRQSPKPSRTLENVSSSSILRAHAGTNPSLSIVISALNDVILSGNWQLRAAAARAISKIALRSGEPYRLHCYGILTSVSLGSHGQDTLGLQGVVKPAIDALDQVYGSQAIVDRLWEEHGGDLDEWPQDVLESVFRRTKFLHDHVETTVCSLPKQSSSFNLLGLKALTIWVHHLGEAEDQDEDSDYDDLLGRVGGGKTGELAKFAKKKDRDQELDDILGVGSSPSWKKKEDKMAELESLLMKSEGGEAGWDIVGVDRSSSRRHSRDTIDSSLEGSSLELSPRAASMTTVTMGTMLHTFIAAPDHPEELSIFEGDIVEVIDLNGQDGWALVQEPSGHRGLVPRSYLDVGAVGGVGGGSVSSLSPRNFSPKFGVDGDIRDGHRVSYETQTYEATAQTSYDEYRADEYDDRFDDVQEVLQSSSPVTQIPQPAIVVQQPAGAHASHRIVHAFQQEEEGELSVEVGDGVKVISEAGGWTKVLRLADGREGLVPSWAVG